MLRRFCMYVLERNRAAADDAILALVAVMMLAVPDTALVCQISVFATSQMC